MADDAQTTPWRRDICAAMVVLQVAGFLMLGVWLMFAGLTMMPFQAAGFSWSLLVRVIPVWIFPIVPVVCTIAAWRAFMRGLFRRAIGWSVVPLVAALPMLILIVVSRGS